MKLEKAVELLQGREFYARGEFWWLLGDDVTSAYTIKVVNPETLLDDIDIDLDNVTDENDLLSKVANGLCHIQKVDSDGVEQGEFED